MEWALGAPYLDRAGVIVALVLGAVNIVWLAVQARDAATTRRIAGEAHAWARERREQEQAAAREEERKHDFFVEMKRRIEASRDFYNEIPEGTDPAWLAEGEALGYFRQVTGTLDEPGPFLARWFPPRS